MMGLHLLITPFSLLVINTNKFTARLLLALDYVEELVANEKNKFKFSQLYNMLSTTETNNNKKVVTLQNLTFKSTDISVLIVLIMGTTALLYFRVFSKVPF